MSRYSYSTLRLLWECPHNYLNKISGIKQPDNDFFKEGREAHAILQKHLSGKELRDDLKHLKFNFPIVEKVDFDPDTKFEVAFGEDSIFGFFDGYNPETGQLLEIKTSSTLWSLQKFKDLVQRKIYGWAMPALTEAILVTGSKDPKKWQYEPPKAIRVPFTEQDKQDAKDWIVGAINKIKAGDFTSDLVAGKCVDPRCYWGENCQFK